LKGVDVESCVVVIWKMPEGFGHVKRMKEREDGIAASIVFIYDV